MKFIYNNSIHSNREKDLNEAKKCAAKAVEKLPAFVEFVKFIFEGTSGKYVEIQEDKIKDAFDCLIERDKCFIYSSDLNPEEKKDVINQTSIEWYKRMEFIKQMFLKEKPNEYE